MTSCNTLNTGTRRLRLACVFLFCVIGFNLSLTLPAGYGWPSVYPTGTTLYQPDKTFNGYTLFSLISDSPSGKSSELYLINMSGETVKTWNVPFSPVLHGRLLPNGNVLVIGHNSTQRINRPGSGKYWMGGSAGWLVELTWEGKQVFKHVDLNMHHDFARLPNGNYLYLAWEVVPPALKAKVRGGIKGSEHADGTMFNDYLVEVTPQGQKVWEWHANQHLDPDIDIIGPIYRRDEWLHVNSLSVLQNGDILLTSRSTDSLLIIERKTGKVVFRWGNTRYWEKNSSQIEFKKSRNVSGGPHDGQQIPPGHPGAGHLLCYDNGVYLDKSRIIEIDPVSQNIIWQSPQAKTYGRMHFSNFLGGVQRLPNGNTLVCDGANGRFFQITPTGETVWEFVNPFISNPAFQGAVFKAHTYAQNYCPQFAALAPALGPAVIPPPNSRFHVTTITTPKTTPEHSHRHYQVVIIALLLLLAAIGVTIATRRK